MVENKKVRTPCLCVRTYVRARILTIGYTLMRTRLAKPQKMHKTIADDEKKTGNPGKPILCSSGCWFTGKIDGGAKTTGN